MPETIRQNAGPGAVSNPDAAHLPLDWWLNAHQEQLHLCAELEQIADSLPASVNRQKCIYAAKALGPMIKGLHHYEENVLFPALETRGLPGDLAKTLARLKFEHFEDECFAEELAERLLLLGAGGSEINMEATGYMLRGFFEAVRRHIAFEREHLIDKLDTVGLEKAG
ncbi:hemerythrin domain-containing protein [Rhizobium sp. TRM95796]|uniref:hemerythrin domain-containing protein n=1 Tax=Rhizobium sp. TRM95796 TaxID=2979862 RepID=UPI0021E893D6|nr:hemerythrin domain-containing protein [Rhizobium sp. TRM95796]MCV3764393.1 hemerythrin domain-containing protein [Rhizobium sp. TRM95796]